ncbi:MAG TPA: prepilin peptidase [Actinomycetota bacterium]|nr:prepilin peptidase [Actinomycetota bacterium]
MDDAWVRAVVALPFGLVIGSFMTVVVSRVPAGGSVIRPRSRCPSCGTPIRSRDNVPVLGWLLLRGRCRNCRQRISAVYPALETVTAALFVAAFVVFDDLWVAALIAALLSLMPAITVIDIQHRIIPNRLMYPALIAFPAYVLVAFAAGGDVDPIRAALGLAIFGGGLFLVAAVSGGMGMGDVKLAALEGVALGALGLRYVGVAAAAAILLGGLGGIVALLLGRGRRSAIPFGPYLAAGAVVAAFWGGPIASSYLDTFS